LRAFRSSDKIRLNANGRRLDAWLIYKCLACDKTWNRPLFERQNVRDIDPAILHALQSNDPDWIRTESFNIEALKRKTERIDEFPEFDLVREVLRETAGWTRVEIELAVPLPAGIRLDRLLPPGWRCRARGFRRSTRKACSGRIRIAPASCGGASGPASR